MRIATKWNAIPKRHVSDHSSYGRLIKLKIQGSCSPASGGQELNPGTNHQEPSLAPCVHTTGERLYRERSVFSGSVDIASYQLQPTARYLTAMKRKGSVKANKNTLNLTMLPTTLDPGHHPSMITYSFRDVSPRMRRTWSLSSTYGEDLLLMI